MVSLKALLSYSSFFNYLYIDGGKKKKKERELNYCYLFKQGFIVVLEGVVIELESIIICLKNAVISFKLLGFPTSASVLEPNSNLSWLQPKFLCQLHFSLGLKLVFHLEVLLQGLHLIHAQSPLFLRDVPSGFF